MYAQEINTIYLFQRTLVCICTFVILPHRNYVLSIHVTIVIHRKKIHHTSTKFIPGTSKRELKKWKNKYASTRGVRADGGTLLNLLSFSIIDLTITGLDVFTLWWSGGRAMSHVVIFVCVCVNSWLPNKHCNCDLSSKCKRESPSNFRFNWDWAGIILHTKSLSEWF